ncbi:hypothetical protein [uncultured Arthrobacter sp.]|uniref:hypothetical protein n=1 Tax=uncultured Arthrobacter sp. TaxID=114050 RepID=UPI0026325225|nr:hypothetical protein [uncultured Arthrobacter sp.]
MRTGIILGVIAVLLVVFPVLNRNFGTHVIVEGAPIAMVFTTLYAFTAAACLLFSAALVSASLIMRHAESLAHKVRA